jgi:hypothetical protein
MKRIAGIAIVAFVVLLAAGLAATARAAVTSVSMVSSTELGRFGHHDYREVEIRMRGTAPGGAYDVPVTLAFPERSKDYSGVAVVDVINTSAVLAPPPLYHDPIPLARVQLTEDYLFGSGHAYLGVHWDKAAVEFLGIGTIAAGGDAWAIIRDAAALARNPHSIPSDSRPEAVSKVIGFDYSQTGALMRNFYFSHQNTTAGGSASMPPCSAALTACVSIPPGVRGSSAPARWQTAAGCTCSAPRAMLNGVDSSSVQRRPTTA